MRSLKTRSEDSTFELNLAPFLDIIVSIIPMLLLSVAFVQIKMIESPTPQVVNEKTPTPPQKPQTQIALKVSNKAGFTFEVTDTKGKTILRKIALNGQDLDYVGLQAQAVRLKEENPEVKQLQLSPDEDVSFDTLVKVMDQVRQKARVEREATSLIDATKSSTVENNDLFPDVIFASVGG